MCMNKRMFVIKYAWLFFVSMHLSLQLMKMFLCFLCLQVCSFICLVGYICLSLVLIAYFVSYKSIYVTLSKSFLSFFLSFSNIQNNEPDTIMTVFSIFFISKTIWFFFLKKVLIEIFDLPDILIRNISLWKSGICCIDNFNLSAVNDYEKCFKIVTRKISFQIFKKFCRWKH